MNIIWNSDDRRLRAVWRLPIQLVCAGGLGSLVSSTVRLESDALQNAMVRSVILAVTLLAGVVLDRRDIRDFGLHLNRRWLLNLVGGLVLGTLMACFVFVIQYSQGWIEVSASPLGRIELARSLAVWLFACIVVVFAEEVMFRGYQLKNLSEGLSRFGPRVSFAVATIVSSTVFGLIHHVNPNSGFFAIVSILLAGVMFCIGRLYTGSLAAPIGLHFAWNYCLAIVFGLPISGQTMKGTMLESEIVNDSIWTGGDFGPEASPLVIVCMVIGVLAFVFWPTRGKIADNVSQLATFRPRNAR